MDPRGRQRNLRKCSRKREKSTYCSPGLGVWRLSKPLSSGTYLGASSRSASGNAADAPVAAPKHHPTEDYPAGGATSPISPARRLATNNEGGSGLPDNLFGASKDSRSDPLRLPDLSEQRERLQQASAPLSRVGPAAGVERGELPRLRDLRVVGQIGSGYILVDEPLVAWIVD
jgi:hypothetical protein